MPNIILAVVQSLSTWLCWSLKHEQHIPADPTSPPWVWMAGGPFHPLHSPILDIVSALSPVVLFGVYIWLPGSEYIHKPEVSKMLMRKAERAQQRFGKYFFSAR